MEPIKTSITASNTPSLITYEEVLSLTPEKVKQFSDFLFSQKAITEDEQVKLEQCSSFEPQFYVTASKMVKIIDFFLLLNGLDDTCKLSLKDSVKDNPQPDLLEKMIIDLKTNEEIDQKMDSAAKGILGSVKYFQVDKKHTEDFDQTLDFLLVTGQFDKANSRLKQLAKDLKVNEPTMIDELILHSITFVLVNAPCWNPYVRRIAIKVGFGPVIAGFKIDEINKHIKMLTTRMSIKSENYKDAIKQYLVSEDDSFAERGYRNRAKVIRCAYSNSIFSQFTKYKIEEAAINEKPRLKMEELQHSKKKQNNAISNINPNTLIVNRKPEISDLLMTVNTLSNQEDRYFALCVMAHHFLPGKDVYESLRCGASLNDDMERLNFIHDLFEGIEANEKDRLVLCLNESIIYEMIETSKKIMDLLKEKTPLLDVLDKISGLSNEDLRSFVLYKMANQLFPNKNVFKWLDKYNALGSDVDRLAELFNFFEKMLEYGDNYLARLQLNVSVKLANRGPSKMIDMINELPDKERRLELFEQILLKEGHDELKTINEMINDLLESEDLPENEQPLELHEQILPKEGYEALRAINEAYDDPKERREALRDFFNI